MKQVNLNSKKQQKMQADDSDIQLEVIDQKKPIKSSSKKLIRSPSMNEEVTKKFTDPFQYLKKNATNLFNQNFYTDDQFKLQDIKSTSSNRKISVARLKDIFSPGTPLFKKQLTEKFGQNKNSLPHYPSFICQLYMLPIWHYQSLIEPKFINDKGFYHVVIWKDGRLIKQTIDDTFYYDQTFKKIYNELPVADEFVWMHLLLKAWAKCKGGYEEIINAEPFQFLKTFSYPDWYIVNPALKQPQKLISKINPIQKKQVMAIAKTKDDPNVGFFGLIPHSMSYIILGHVMQYHKVFIKIKSLTGTKWNGLKSDSQTQMPQQEIHLQNSNEFIIPIKEFINVFHLIYVTSNKYAVQQDIFYNRYSLNLDARQSKAKMVAFQVSGPDNIPQEKQKESEYMTNLTIYFPSVRAYDLAKQKTQSDANSQAFVIPYCKLMIGLQSQTTNLEASFVQSMKQKMLENDQTDFLCVKSNIQYEWKQGTYFKGYDNTCTFLMKLKPGKYFLRFKIQTLRVQYRANINIVSSTQVKITDPKMDRKQQQQFLREVISSKARIEKRNIGYFNPIKKGSWYICNDDFQSIGYGYIVIQTRKNSDYKIEVKIDPKKLRQAGFRLKDKKQQNKYSITLEDGQGQTIILKMEDDFDSKKQKIWPPPGIQTIRLWRTQLQKQK